MTGTPFGDVTIEGVMLMPVSTAAVTVSVVADETPFNDAVIVVLPTAAPVATPVELLMVATLALADDHVTLLVMSVVVLSE